MPRETCPHQVDARLPEATGIRRLTRSIILSDSGHGLGYARRQSTGPLRG